jgi:ribosomal-protein-alanine N-acetyltransferase
MLSILPRDTTPTLRTERLLLRGPRMHDYAAWAALRRRSRTYLQPFEPRWSEADLAPRVFSARIRRSREEARAGTDFSFLVFRSEGGTREALVGGITLSNIRRRASQSGTLGYWMGEEFAAQGLMSEAVGAVVAFGFDQLGLHRLHAAIMPHNAASRRVLEKNGFREEGYAESYLQIDGAWRDHVLFGLVRDRHLAGKSKT